MPAAALQITELGFAYGTAPALHGINLTIRAGERVGLIGANGCGKTTLFLLVCGVLPPAHGSIQVFGTAVQAGRFNPAVGLVFQHPDDQLFCPTVREDIAFGPTNMGLAPDAITARTTAAMHATGTTHLAERAPHQLSGGEKRMVAIAGILAMQPRLLVLDEPESHLDSRARRNLITLLQHTPETLLIASHDLYALPEICTRLLLLGEGRIVADGTPEGILQDAALLQRHGLDAPHLLPARSAAHP